MAFRVQYYGYSMITSIRKVLSSPVYGSSGQNSPSAEEKGLLSSDLEAPSIQTFFFPEF